ncbi:MAG: hypothetical protein OEZ01_11985 [Candidatus Heimdallarchaeota archaeon]|nr:hypothetical protein [Candidatus Heimdallarchaeota archaeon]
MLKYQTTFPGANRMDLLETLDKMDVLQPNYGTEWIPLAPYTG